MQIEKMLTTRIEKVEAGMEEKAIQDKEAFCLVSGEIETVANSYQTLETKHNLLSSSTKTELAALASKLSNLKAPDEAVPMQDSPPVEGQGQLAE